MNWWNELSSFWQTSIVTIVTASLTALFSTCGALWLQHKQNKKENKRQEEYFNRQLILQNEQYLSSFMIAHHNELLQFKINLNFHLFILEKSIKTNPSIIGDQPDSTFSKVDHNELNEQFMILSASKEKYLNSNTFLSYFNLFCPNKTKNPNLHLVYLSKTNDYIKATIEAISLNSPISVNHVETVIENQLKSLIKVLKSLGPQQIHIILTDYTDFLNAIDNFISKRQPT